MLACGASINPYHDKRCVLIDEVPQKFITSFPAYASKTEYEILGNVTDPPLILIVIPSTEDEIPETENPLALLKSDALQLKISNAWFDPVKTSVFPFKVHVPVDVKAQMYEFQDSAYDFQAEKSNNETCVAEHPELYPTLVIDAVETYVASPDRIEPLLRDKDPPETSECL